LNTQRKVLKGNELIIKRYDPLLGLGKEIVKSKEEECFNETKAGVQQMKLMKGYNPLLKNSTVLIDNDKRIVNKEKDLSDVINFIQEKELKDVKVEVDYGFFRSLVKSKDDKNKNVYGSMGIGIGMVNGNIENIDNIDDNKDNTVNIIDVNNDKPIEKDGLIDLENEKLKKKERKLLKKKRKLEKREEEIKEKKEKILNQIKNDEKREKRFKKKVLHDGVSEEKYDNYMRMINMISEKKKYRMNIKE
jgi:hypothetical protein